ncbi:MAG: (Fe-S)-binding protein [Planctomycetes bacterium]|nr:(Fe-S)-binding protein [Planctomycetota bacterium]
MTHGVDAYARTLDCVHCGLCLESCPTYGVLGVETDSPRGRIYLMRAIAEQRVEDVPTVRQHIDQCLGCRACETACPSGVRYGHLLELVRTELAERAPQRGFAARLTRFLLAHVVAHQGRLRTLFSAMRLAERLGLRRLAFALRILPKRMDGLVPRVPPAAERGSLAGRYRPPTGAVRATVGLFTGCVMEQVFGRINRVTLELLLHNGFEVVVPAEQACCGALLLHDGQAGRARPLAERNVRAFAGVDFVVNNSAGCGAALRDYGSLLGTDAARDFATRCRDVTELLAEQGMRAAPAPFPHRVAYDAPCHLCHGQGVHRQPAELLRQVPGLELAEHPTSEDCCGSAGIYNLLQPELAGEIGRRKIRALLETGASHVATGNPGCMMQIRAHLADARAAVEVVHPVELLLPPAAADRGSTIDLAAARVEPR